ncbi:MAG: hypothetical protein WD533_06560 [Dehalococcoidia bacterium]
MTTPLRVLSFGVGVQSWTLAAMMALGELELADYTVFADTKHESVGTYQHLMKWTPWLEERGHKVIVVESDRTEVVREDWSDSVLIPAFTVDSEDGSHGIIKRQCTHDWKIMPIRRFVRTLLPAPPAPGSVVSIQGISWDEARRMRESDVAYITHEYPLVDLRMTRSDCILWLVSHGLDVPPKSGCVFCPYTSIGRWKARKRAGGEDWRHAVEVDSAIRSKRPKAALFVHPYRKALAEAVEIPEDHGAAQLALELDPEAPCDSGACFV